MDTIDLTGKVALVTGSSRGLGREYAFTLARAGADVIIHDVNETAAAEFGEASSGPTVAQEIESLGVRSIFLAADLRDPAQVEQMVESAIQRFGRIDILVNNAGGDIGAADPRPDPNDALDIKVEDIRAVVERNLLATMYTCKFVGVRMRENGAGKIVNVGSVAGHLPVTGGIIYAAAKMGISHYTRCLAEQLRSDGVNVNCVAPAPTYTGRFMATRTVRDQDDLPRLRKVWQPADMAKIVLFLVSGQSDLLSGETIVCWGGN
ncbi:SDR family NAD(P)-dependent oxidoreductase [Alicyclobacillus fastidiosus]|uniref:SDR family oxidoreductase n=1 Tax=Alicyclobacillus fastidiosus TaxID=392011 RepID=A0ABV5ADS2_9BACL|nr:SDR family oxidoreductase [Alicyclobacillus fastidiosus]WEH12046.1 SDR family NAD(P)-dependent oxidoreductase [Alicyclobacillus fastidiosus]